MSLAASPRPEFRFTGWHFLAVIVTFFGIVIATDTYFTILAVKTFPGEVSSTPYEDGLAYDKAFAQLQAQNKLGWRATAAAEPEAVAFEVRGKDGAPVSHLAVTGELERPATEAGKIALTFHETRPGRYVARTQALHGLWDFTAHATGAAGVRFNADRRLAWR
ncbi:MAG: FixH family protein [Phenylobacterium sp.]